MSLSKKLDARLRPLLENDGGGRLVHWIGMPEGACPRKDAVSAWYASFKARQLAEIPVDVEEHEGGSFSIGLATHYGNITCKVCRKVAWKAGVR